MHGGAEHHTKTRELPPAVASKDTPEQLYRFWRHRRPRLCLPSQPPPRHQTDINASFRLDLLDTPAAKHQRLRGRAGHTWPLWPMPVSTMVMRTEQTIVYYCATRGLDGGMCTHFWQDEKRSSHAKGIIKRVVGNVMLVLNSEALSVRVLEDHSMIESFTQGGMSTTTLCMYPTKTIYTNARVYLFNNNAGIQVITFPIFYFSFPS